MIIVIKGDCHLVMLLFEYFFYTLNSTCFVLCNENETL